MKKENLNYTILRNCYKNAQMAILSLNDVIGIAKGGLKNELIAEHEGYNKIMTKIAIIAQKLNVELPTVNALQKGMLSASINLKTIADDSDSHIAEMTLKGTVIGVTELIRDISEYGHLLNEEVYNCLEELKDFEEKCEKELKKYI